MSDFHIPSLPDLQEIDWLRRELPHVSKHPGDHCVLRRYTFSEDDDTPSTSDVVFHKKWITDRHSGEQRLAWTVEIEVTPHGATPPGIRAERATDSLVSDLF